MIEHPTGTQQPGDINQLRSNNSALLTNKTDRATRSPMPQHALLQQRISRQELHRVRAVARPHRLLGPETRRPEARRCSPAHDGKMAPGYARPFHRSGLLEFDKIEIAGRQRMPPHGWQAAVLRKQPGQPSS